MDDLQPLEEHIRQSPIVRLFLDYDGTLADFAPNPDVILPDPHLIQLMGALVRKPNIFPAVISGRRLDHIRKLLPVEGVLLAGTYGVEIWLPDDELRTRADYAHIRPVLEQLSVRWKPLLEERAGFYLEDKGWALAIHAGKADEREAETVLQAAQAEIDILKPGDAFRILGGDQFLELAPRAANKGSAVGWVLANQSPVDAFPVYIGDDDKDEEAYKVVLALGGAAVKVGGEDAPTHAPYRLQDPAAVRDWLAELAI